MPALSALSISESPVVARAVKRGESPMKDTEVGESPVHTEPVRLKRCRGAQLGIEVQTTGRKQTHSQVAFIDWLGFTVRGLTLDDLHCALQHAFGLTNLPWTETNKGWSGYEKKVELGQYGWIAHGGKAQQGTINIQLRPVACRQFKHLAPILNWVERVEAKITRCDVAHDDFEGERINIDQARQWQSEGGYISNGRAPKVTEIINHDATVGNTFYVGKRENGKMLRIYDKGKEQGQPDSPWVRAEVEFRAKDRHIPWDILKHPGQYLAGAYPCLSFINQLQDVIKTAKASFSVSYEKMVTWTRRACGRAINAMLIREQGDVIKVMEALRREGLPERLSGLFDVLPDYAPG